MDRLLRRRIVSLLLAALMTAMSFTAAFAVDGVQQATTEKEEATEVTEELADTQSAVDDDLMTEDAESIEEYDESYVEEIEAELYAEESAEIGEDEEASDIEAEEPVILMKAAADPATGTDTATEKKTVTAPEKIADLVAYPGYNSVTLRWSKVSGASYYRIERKEGKKGKYKVLAKTVKASKYTLSSDKTKMSYRDKKAKGKNVMYYYKVYAVKKADGKTLKSTAATAKSKCVRPMYEKITFKSGCTLSSHGGKRRTVHFNGGQTVTAEGFGGGKYKFYYKDSLFYASYTRMTNCKADYIQNPNGAVLNYTKKWDKKTQSYDQVTAENFVNESGQASRTKYLIWVSTYTQHLYIFKGKKGHWKLYKDWEVSTGKAASPTPSGFNKSLQERMRSYSGISYWWKFQSLNSIHGKRTSYYIGEPASHGCVRNFDSNAKWMYNNLGKGTGLIVY